MSKFFILVCVFISTFAKAEPDSCDLNIYPIKWQDTLMHAESYSLPAISYTKDNSRVIVSVNDALSFVKASMSEHKPFLKKAKTHIIQSLQKLNEKKIIDYSILLVNLDSLTGEELNIGIHVMAGYEGIFEGTLLNKKAAVEVNNDLVVKTKGKYFIGKDPSPMHGLDYVHKLSIAHKNTSVFKKCWMARE